MCIRDRYNSTISNMKATEARLTDRGFILLGLRSADKNTKACRVAEWTAAIKQCDIARTTGVLHMCTAARMQR
eukprot:1461991-Alexandrium_andersonii.AAC.1